LKHESDQHNQMVAHQKQIEINKNQGMKNMVRQTKEEAIE